MIDSVAENLRAERRARYTAERNAAPGKRRAYLKSQRLELVAMLDHATHTADVLSAINGSTDMSPARTARMKRRGPRGLAC